MIRITIGGSGYYYPTDWQDVSIARQIKIEELSRKLPKSLQDHLVKVAKQEEDDVKKKEQQQYEDFAVSLMRVVGEVDPGVEVDKADAVRLLEVALYPYVLLSFGYALFDSEKKTEFEWRKKVYTLPKYGVDVGGTEKPMIDSNALRFCLATDLAATNTVQVAPYLVAVMTATNDELRDEATIRERAQLFEGLPMRIYLEAMTIITEAHKYLKSEYKACYTSGKGVKSAKTEEITWDERINYVAGSPVDVARVEEMNVYDFVRYLNAHIKDDERKMGIQ